jgi:multidrug efflux pump subunit AcrB
VTLSFNLAPGHTIGEAVRAIQETVRELKRPPSIATSFHGNAQAFENSLGSTPILIVAALVAVYLILVVWSRNEMARVDFEGGGVVRPGIADSLIGRSPSQRL